MRAWPIALTMVFAALVCSLAHAQSKQAPPHQVSAPQPAARSSDCDEGALSLTARWGDALSEGFDAPGLLLRGAAFSSSAALIVSGQDHRLRVVGGRDATALKPIATPTVLAGYLLPLTGPVVHWVARASGSCRAATMGTVQTQATADTLLEVGLLKVLSGRPFPLHGGSPEDPTRFSHPRWAQEFHPLRPDRGWSWPSGHVAVAAALATSTAVSQPELWPWIPGAALTTTIALGMWSGEHHWPSDILSGASIGIAHGLGAARAHRDRGRAGATMSWQLVPWTEGRGVWLIGPW